jgi:hypothetical protein
MLADYSGRAGFEQLALALKKVEPVAQGLNSFARSTI